MRQLLLLRPLRQDAARAADLLQAARGRRGLFIDCGSILGQGFAYFKKHFPADRFDYILVEPNPYCVAHLRASASTSEGIEIIAAAASSRDGEAILYGVTEGADCASLGGSIVTAHPSAWEREATPAPVSVRTFSLG